MSFKIKEAEKWVKKMSLLWFKSHPKERYTKQQKAISMYNMRQAVPE